MTGDHEITSTDFERNLIRVAVVTSCALGLVFGLTRFLFLLRNDLKESAMTWPEILLVIVIFGSVTILIALACAALGFLLGVTFNAVIRICGLGPHTKPREALRLSQTR